jgi:hypothetical protein
MKIPRGDSKSLPLLFALSPLSHGTNHSVNNQAHGEVKHHAKVHAKWAVPGYQRQRWQQREVHHIAQNDGEQGLKEV